MIDLPPAPKLWVPERPAIVRSLEPNRAERRALVSELLARGEISREEAAAGIFTPAPFKKPGAAGASPATMFNVSTWTGNSTARSITTGLPMSTDGGLVWIKSRSVAQSAALFDTLRGVGNMLFLPGSNTSETAYANSLTAFNADGFSLGADTSATNVNYSGFTYVAWTFLRKAGFLDIKLYPGQSSTQTVSHNLGSVPGMIIIRARNGESDYIVWHRSLSTNQNLVLNTTAGTALNGWITNVTSTSFDVPWSGAVNAPGYNYVAYLFAHAPSGNIQCGLFTTDASGNAAVNLGWAPQYLMLKRTSAGDWEMFDTTRGTANFGGNDPFLRANTTAAEASFADYVTASSSGFSVTGYYVSQSLIYMAVKAP